MSKVMIVEDDASLREIYGIRIAAEGYTIVSAGDGEEALAVAVREKPDLILSDVMMPKISGFDMLDILRSTPETHDIKVIMMTALSSEDQRIRGENLGADRYLVKSQIGIEDVVNVIHEVLGDRGGAAAPASAANAKYTPATTESASAQTVAPVPQPTTPVQSANSPVAFGRPDDPNFKNAWSTWNPQVANGQSMPSTTPVNQPTQPGQAGPAA
ncbi:response regulator [Candidatus Saccharibacteria bacterium]|nr:response regulator [Candidatus Saccharibacteria bacterium]